MPKHHPGLAVPVRQSHQLQENKIKELETAEFRLLGVPDAQKEEVMRLFGAFYSYESIKQWVVENLGERAVLNDVKVIEKVCKNPANKLKVLDYRHKYLKSIKDHWIFHKTCRIEKLQDIANDYLQQISKLDKEDRYEREEFRYMARGLSEILAKAQDEVEGKGMNIQVGLGIFDMGDLDGKTDDELISRRQELLAKAERAIGIASVGSSGRQRIAGDNADSKDVIEAQAIKSS